MKPRGSCTSCAAGLGCLLTGCLAGYVGYVAVERATSIVVQFMFP